MMPCITNICVIFMDTEEVFLEPSACAGFQGPVKLFVTEAAKAYLKEQGLDEKMEHAFSYCKGDGRKSGAGDYERRV